MNKIDFFIVYSHTFLLGYLTFARYLLLINLDCKIKDFYICPENPINILN